MAPIQTPQETIDQIIEQFIDDDCAMRIEHDEINNTWRYNYFCRNEIVNLNHAYIIQDEYGTEHFTELEPPVEFYNNDDYIVINMLEME